MVGRKEFVHRTESPLVLRSSFCLRRFDREESSNAIYGFHGERRTPHRVFGIWVKCTSRSRVTRFEVSDWSRVDLRVDNILWGSGLPFSDT